ncbi:MAG TPA: hypothetical protein VH369_11845 [Bryobacteraceae bacterium]|jgi:hypothetical protein
MRTRSLLSAAFFLAASSLYGGVISSANISGGACSPSQTVADAFAATASVSCTGPASSAAADISFAIGSPSLANLSFSDSAAPFNVSTSTASFDYMLVILGQTGTGFLALDYLSDVSGFNDPQASANASFEVKLNGATLDSGRLCGNTPGMGGPFSCSFPMPIGFGFTYGTPFELAISVTGVAGGGLGGSNISGTGSFSYAILPTSTGQPDPGSTLNLVVPEPATGGLIFAIAMLLAYGFRARTRRGGFEGGERS